jgi:hypothetical protein
MPPDASSFDPPSDVRASPGEIVCISVAGRHWRVLAVTERSRTLRLSGKWPATT